MKKPKGSLISYMANKVKSEGGLNLAQGIPAFDPPQELMKLLSGVALGSFHQYAPGKGNPLLLEQLSLHYNKPIADFLIVNGATEAISTIFTYINKQFPDSALLSFSPVYESYKHLPRIFNTPFVNHDLKDGNIDFNLLQEQIEANNVKTIIFASPGNPLGKIWSRHELDELIALVNKYDLYLIVDAVYSDLFFDEKPQYPIENITKNIFYVNAFSKKFSITGWRIGYLLSHPIHMDALMDIHDYIGLSSPSVLQQALAIYLKEHNFGTNYCIDLRATLKANYLQMANALKELGFTVVDAQGGYFIWCSLPAKFESGLEFAINLYESKKVAVVPGIHFAENGNKMIRLNIARHAYEISMAIDRIKSFIDEN